MSNSSNSIQMGGLVSGIDTKSIIDQLLQVERVPIESLEKKKELNQAKIDTWNDITTQLRDLSDITKKLRADGTSGYTLFDDKIASSADESVATATATPQAAEGNYSLAVTQIAQPHTVYGEKKSSDYTLSTAGSMTLNGAEIFFSGGETLEEIVNTINQTSFGSEDRVVASIIDNRLILQTEKMGKNHRIQEFTSQPVAPSDLLRGSSNESFATAQEILETDFHFTQDTDVVNSETEAHVTIDAGVNGGQSGNSQEHFYKFEATAGETIRLDLDYGNATGSATPSGTDFNAALALYKENPGGDPILIAISSGATLLSSEQSSGSTTIDGLPTHTYDPFLEQTLVEDATYYVKVQQSNFTPLSEEATYQLHVTRTGITEQNPQVALDPNGILQELGIINGEGIWENVAQEPQNAQFSLDGIQIERETNAFDDALKGLSFSFFEEGETRIEVAHDTKNIKETIKEFIATYNETRDLLSSVRNITLSEEEKFGPFFSDSLLRGLFNEVRSLTTLGTRMGGEDWNGNLFLSSYVGAGDNQMTIEGFDNENGTLRAGDMFTLASTGESYRLAEEAIISNGVATLILENPLSQALNQGDSLFTATRSLEDFGVGVRTDSGSGTEGILGLLDEAKLDQMLQTDLKGMRKLFTRSDSTSQGTGVARRIYDWLDRQTKISPFISKKRSIDDAKIPSLEQENQRIDQQIARLEENIQNKEQSLVRQFARMEEWMSKSQSLEAILGNLGGSNNNSK